METSDPDCLRDLFDQFCAFGAGQSSSFRMDGATFTKFCKDTGLLDKQLNKTAVDLIFMQSKQKTERKISFEEFRDQAIPLLAQRKFPSVDPATATGRLVALALQCPGPVATATRTSTMGIYAKLTDASLYTGHHRVRAGGAREPAARSRSPRVPARRPVVTGGPHTEGKGEDAPPETRSDASRSHSPAQPAAPGIADVPTGAYSESALHHVFSQFAQFGNTKQQADDAMDNAKFAKFARDTKLVGRTLTATDVDLIFAKAKPSSARKLDYIHFKVALTLIAERKYPDKDTATAERLVLDQVCAARGPSVSGTRTQTKQSIFERLTDSTKYTGAHKHRFDGAGQGRGLEGRDSVSKGAGVNRYRGGAVKDLSQLVTRR